MGFFVEKFAESVFDFVFDKSPVGGVTVEADEGFEDAFTRKVITRISPDTAAAIRADYASGIGSYRLAKKYGRSATAIKDLVRGGAKNADCA